MRKFGTTSHGTTFDMDTIAMVWAKATVVPGADPNVLRKDVCGAWIAWANYGDTSASTGWEVDHVFPAALGGRDVLSNLQPLQWQNNRHKSDNLSWTCKVQAA